MIQQPYEILPIDPFQPLRRDSADEVFEIEFTAEGEVVVTTTSSGLPLLRASLADVEGIGFEAPVLGDYSNDDLIARYNQPEGSPTLASPAWRP